MKIKPGMVAHACYSKAGGAKQVDSWCSLLNQSSLINELWPMRDPCFKGFSWSDGIPGDGHCCRLASGLHLLHQQKPLYSHMHTGNNKEKLYKTSLGSEESGMTGKPCPIVDRLQINSVLLFLTCKGVTRPFCRV